MIKTILPLATIVALSSCGNSNAEKNTALQDTALHSGKHRMEMTGSDAPGGTFQFKDEKLNAVYQHYVHLTTALTNGDAGEARIAGSAIEAGAREFPGQGSLVASAVKITASSDIESQRAAYAVLSNELIALTKRSGLSGGELYVDFCPMAMDEKGAYWLSTTRAIKNPYMGEKMESCGEITDTIK